MRQAPAVRASAVASAIPRSAHAPVTAIRTAAPVGRASAARVLTAQTAVNPTPSALGQVLYVDSTNPGINGGTYAGPTYTVANGDAYSVIYDGYNGTGSIIHSSGTLTIGDSIYMGFFPGSSGSYSLSGTASLNVANFIFVGYNEGAGTFTQTGGTVTTNGGAVDLGFAFAKGSYFLNGGTLTTGTVAGGGYANTFNFDGGTLQAGTNNTAFLQNLTTASVQAGGAIIDTQSFNVTIPQSLTSGTASGTPDGGLTKLGTGTLIVTGTNTYTGPTTVNAGLLEAATVAALPGYNAAGKVMVASGATLAANVGGTGQWTAAELNTLRGDATFNKGSALGIDTTAATGGFLYASNVSGSLGLTKLGGNQLTLTGTNTYTGTTTVDAGILELGSTGALPTGGAVTVNSGGTLAVPTSLYPTSAALNSVRSSANITFNAGSAFGVDTGSSATDFTYSSNLSGPAGVTKLGSGTGALILSGASTYTGATGVNAGALTVPAGASVAGTAAVSVGVGAQLTVNGSVTSSGNLTVDGTSASPAAVLVGSGATLSANDMIVGNNGTGSLAQAGGSITGVLSLGYSAGSSGSYILSGGTLTAGDAYIGMSGSGSLVQSAGVENLTDRLVIGSSQGGSGSYTLSGSGALSASQEYVGNGGNGVFTQNAGSNIIDVGRGMLNVTNSPGVTGTYVLNGGSLSAGIEQLGNAPASSQATFTQNGGINTSQAGLMIGFGGCSATYSLNGGTLQVPSIQASASASTFQFNGGTLRAGTSTTSFVAGLTTANVQTGGAKIDTNGYNVTVIQPLVHDSTSGAPAIDGGLTKLDAGVLTLAAANTYTGITTVSAGTLAVSVNGGLGKGNVTIAAGATLSLGTGVTAAHNASTGTALTLASTTTSLVNLAGTGVQDIVTSLIINGTTEPNGTYGAPGSGAAYTGLADFTGTGELSVVPEPSAWVLLTGAGPWLVAAVRRRRVV